MNKPTINDYKLKGSRTYKTFDGTINWKKYADALDAYIAAVEVPQPEKEEWISVDDRLPSDNDFMKGQKGDVLVSLDDGTVLMGQYTDTVGEWLAYWADKGLATAKQFYIRRRITHWMPLPKPPVF